jgi:flagellar biosynthetic protein FliQ
MNADWAIDLTRQAVALVLVLALPVLGVGLVVALVVSVLQAVTQVQEQTLSFVPKILAMLAALLAFGGWMMERITEFARDVFSTLP